MSILGRESEEISGVNLYEEEISEADARANARGHEMGEREPVLGGTSAMSEN